MARSVQNISYTGFNKTGYISVVNNNNGIEQKWELNIEYGPDNFRRTTRLVMNNELVKFKTFVGGNYEIETDARGKQRKLHYISGGSGLCAIYVTDDASEDGKMYYILKDHLGSIYAVTSEEGEIAIHNGRQQVYSFDPWGRRRNHNDWTFQDVPTAYLFDRGFTKHEHLDELGLINMNGRMYEPWLGRFLSPDNYVQMPGYSQNLNRYSYALNNPLIFTDPDGEFAMLGALGLFIFGSIVDHLVNPGDYDDENIGEAIKAGFNQGVNAFDEINSVSQFQVYSDDHFRVTVGPSLTSLGVSGSVTYTNGDFSFGISGGTGFVVNPETSVSALESSIGGGVTYYDAANDQSFSAYANRFGGTHNQYVGGIGYSNSNFSLRIENDFFAFRGEDRWRTYAVEMSFGSFIIGTNVYTNDPGNNIPNGESGIEQWGRNLRGKQNKHGFGAWVDGQVYSAPLYVGYRRGNSVTRIGINNPWVQDRTQNFIHKNFGIGNFSIGYQNFYNKYDYFTEGINRITSYSGYYNPYTLF